MYPELTNQIDLSKEGQENYYKNWILYNSWKNKITDKINETESRIRITGATICCETCNDRLTSYKCIGDMEEQVYIFLNVLFI